MEPPSHKVSETGIPVLQGIYVLPVQHRSSRQCLGLKAVVLCGLTLAPRTKKLCRISRFLFTQGEDVGRSCQKSKSTSWCKPYSLKSSNNVMCMHLHSVFGWQFQNVGFSSPEMLNPFQVGPAPSKIYCESPCAALR